MIPTAVEDNELRLRAVAVLGPLGYDLALGALEAGTVFVEHDVTSWDGSHGTTRGHRVIVSLRANLHARVVASHMAMDALQASLAAAMSERIGHSVTDVRIELNEEFYMTSSPYRDSHH